MKQQTLNLGGWNCVLSWISPAPSFSMLEVVYLARWWQSLAFAISADAYGPADRVLCVCLRFVGDSGSAERNGWSWPHCGACRALQNPYLWQRLVSSYRSRPSAVSCRNQISRQVNCLRQSQVLHGDDVIVQGPSLHSVPGFGYEGCNKMKI